MKYVKVLRGADASSNHHLLLCKLRMKQKKTMKKISRKLFDLSKAKEPTVQF